MIKRLIKSIVIIALLFFAIDFIAGSVLHYLFKRTTTVDAAKMCHVIYRADDSILFMGSSRCHHSYIPEIIRDSLNKSVFNAGLWGMRNIYFQYGFLSNILERYSPEYICFEFHPSNYYNVPFTGWERVGSLGPFIGVSEGCDEVLKEGGFYYKFLISRIYRYNSELPRLISGNIFKRTDEHSKGYYRLDAIVDTAITSKEVETFPYKMDPRRYYYFKKFAQKCREHNIKLFLLESPALYPNLKDTCFHQLPQHLADKFGMTFIDCYNVEGFRDHPELYSDVGHFNDVGARKYSSYISKILKQYIK